MKEGQPTYEQLCQVIGSIYADAYLRIQFLENENRQLREDRHNFAESSAKLHEELRKENARLKGELASCTNGNGNFMLPELLRQRLNTESKELSYSLSALPEKTDSTPPKFTVQPGETPNSTVP